MKTIVALRGVGNSGKSATIRNLHSLLLQNEYRQVSSNFNPEGGDFIAIFSRNGKLIGVTSSGDKYKLVHDCLQKLVNVNCDICICACRSFDRKHPGTNAAILEFADYTNQFVEKTIDNNEVTQQTTNGLDAQNLLSIIDNLLSG